MTVRQIAEITGKSEQAIRMAVRRICPEVNTQQGAMIDLSEYQTLRVLKKYQSSFRIEQPMQNGEVLQHSVEVHQRNVELPNGKQLEQIRLLAEENIITPLQVQILLNLNPSTDKYDRLGKWVAEQKRKKDRLKIEQDKHQGKLFSERN